MEVSPQQLRLLWNQKPVLQRIYHDYYKRILTECKPGRSLEIGGGFGNFKQYFQEVITVDIQPVVGLDAIADAQTLPFKDESFDNIIMVDVLHHLEVPCLFLKEAVRVLRKGGRIVMVEPAITPLSWFFYSFFHPEPVDLNQNPFLEGRLTVGRNPYESNQAIPTLLFHRCREQLKRTFPSLIIRNVQFLSLFAYPLSGGFRRWSLLPSKLVKPLLRIEDFLLSIIGPGMAFRLFISLERQ